MTNTFLKQAQSGENHWWRYLLTVVATVAGIAIANIAINQILPTFKAQLPDNQFGKDLGMSILIGLVFASALIVFALASKKLHNRPLFSYISVDSKFNWSSYLKGFLIWGVLLFLGVLITDFDIFQTFLDSLNITHFIILFFIGFISFGLQTFFEELLIRGYFLQGMHLKIKNIVVLVVVNSLIFGVLHFGYGIESFISSFTFGIAFVIIVIWQDRIEFVSGAHNANNLLLSLVFLDINEATNAAFSWTINWTEIGIHLLILSAFVGIVYKFSRKKYR